ncbi:hypothetical protein KR215_011928, partial [Drosophila sulfurigaster]
LSGHGCFKGYLHRFGHASEPYCAHCEHVFLHCGRFAGAREELEARLEGRVETESVVEPMISSREKWVAVNTMAVAVMKQLRREERAQMPANS